MCRWDFTSAGGNSLTRYITCLDDGVWVNMGSLALGRVNAIALSGGYLYAGCNAPNYIQVWDGAAWTDLGGGLSGSAYALGVSDSDLYVGGSFYQNNYIQRWGTDWQALFLPLTVKP